MDVASVLRSKGSNVVTIDPDRTVTEALSMLELHNLGALVVSRDGTSIAGIVSERDIVRRLARAGTSSLQESISSVATTTVHTCAPEDSIDQIMAVMTDGRFRHIPVVAAGQLTGLISIGDVVKHRVAELELANNQLESYITGVPR